MTAMALLSACALQQTDRAASIPAGTVKMTPGSDSHPPILHSGEFRKPVPLGPGVNTAGGEDSPFITPDGSTLYFFFTPDVAVPANRQLFDGVTGIWVSRRDGKEWGRAERVPLQAPGKLALDGAPTVRADCLWFVSAREGFEGVHHFVAKRRDGAWTDWEHAGDRLCRGLEVGEMHLGRDGTMYFHSKRAGGKGGLDIWSLRKERGEWQTPMNVAPLNTPGDEGWPFISEDGQEFWFLRTHRGSPALFRSKRAGASWAEPELIVSTFAGEPTLDRAGNLYFVHHYYRDGKMIEADIYVAERLRR
jgi:hypothetical protein